MKTIIERIRENDPEYDPLAFAIEATPAADLPRYREAQAKTLGQEGLTKADYVRAALSRVNLDGLYGPFSGEDWQEQDGRRPYSVSDALEVLAAVSENIEGYSEFVYVGEDENGELIEEMQEVASAHDIRRAVFATIVEIYGGLPW